MSGGSTVLTEPARCLSYAHDWQTMQMESASFDPPDLSGIGRLFGVTGIKASPPVPMEPTVRRCVLCNATQQRVRRLDGTLGEWTDSGYFVQRTHVTIGGIP